MRHKLVGGAILLFYERRLAPNL